MLLTNTADYEEAPGDVLAALGLEAVPVPVLDRRQDTHQLYLRHASLLVRRWQREQPREQGLSAFLGWAIACHAANITSATWRFSRSAVVRLLRWSSAAERADAIAEEFRQVVAGRPDNRGRGKVKRVDPVDLTRLTEALMEMDDKWSAFAISWLRAGRLAGLRPNEWWQARLIENDLIVLNGKYSGERACGRERRLDLTAFSEEDRQIIADHLELTEAIADDAGRRAAYAGCQAVIRRAVKTLWPDKKHGITLYSMRHAAAADWKLVFSRRGVAALMGHASAKTAGCHYGNYRHVAVARRKVEASSLPLPSPENAALVRHTAEASLLREQNPENFEPDGKNPGFSRETR